MNTPTQHPGPNYRIQPPVDQSRSARKTYAWRTPSIPLICAGWLAVLVLLLFGAPEARADRNPPGCLGSGLGISLFTSLPDVHVGDTISYSINVFNTAFPACDAGEINAADAGAIHAYIVTPDGVTNNVVLRRTFLAPGEFDYYTNIVSYVVRAQDIRSDGTLRATAVDAGDIHQNDTNSKGGGNQGVNTEVNLPCISIAAQCVSSAGENGAISFSGTVTNCGNTPLIGVTVTNFYDGGSFTVLFPTNLATGQSAPFNGSYIPLNPCVPSTAVLTARGVDEFTSTPRTVTASATIVCQNTLTPGIKVTKVCPEQPVSPGQLLTFSGSVSNTGNVTLTNIVVVDNQPAPNTPVFSRAILAPGEVVSFNGSYIAPTNCSVTDTLTATANSRCGVPVSSVATATCPILTTPQIAVTVVCPATPAVSGGTLTYSGTVFNTGDITLTNIVVVSDRPAPNTSVFTLAKLEPGASANFTTSITVPADVCSITTTFTAQGKDLCTLNPVTKTTVTTCPITTSPAIAVTLVCPTVPVATGAPITYSGTVRNSGNVTLKNVVVANDQSVPATVLTVPTLAPGASANFTASFTTPSDACSVSSTVTATGRDACSDNPVNTSASATCPLVTAPHLIVTQNCPQNPVGLGGVLTYTGTVRNDGNVTLTNVVVTNDRTGTTSVFTVATLAPGASADFTGSYTVPASAGCAITSTLTASARDKCTSTQVTANATATCPLQGAASIAVVLNCPGTPTPLGGQLNFSGNVRNSGNITLTNVVVTRDTPSPGTVVFRAASLAAGASTNFTGSYTVPASDSCSITTAVTASANDQCAGSGVIANSSIDCPLATTPRIVVTQSCPENPGTPGGVVVFGGIVNNAGNVTLTNITVVSSQPVANTVVFIVGILAPGASATFSSSFNAPLDTCSATATLAATGQNQCNGTTVNNSVTTVCPLLTAPQISVTKACPATAVTEGGSLVYTGTVTNTGNVTLTNVLVVSDHPAANTRVLGPITLAPGAGTNFTGSYTTPLNVCSVTDTLQASGQDKCTGTKASNSTTTSCPIITIPRIAVTLACPAVAAAAGGPISFTGTVRNSGNVTLNNVVVSNDRSVPSIVLTVPSLAPGASANFTATFTAPADACSVSSAVTAIGSDACSEVRATADAAATCPLVTAPAIVVTQVCPELPAIPGGLLTYRGTVKNSGNVTLTNVVVVNNLSGATPVFTAATLVPGQELGFTGSFVAPTNCAVTSTSTATGRSVCGVAVNNSVSSTCSVLTAPGIAVTAVCPSTPIVIGGLLTYSGTVRNNGNIALTNVTVLSDRPAAGTKVFTVASLAPGASAPYTASFTVPATDCSVTTTVAATGQDTCTGSPVQNSAVITCTVATTPSIAVTLACPTSPASVGGQITYSGTVRNSGNVTLNNVVVVNNQPAPGTPVTGPITLAPGASANFTTSFTAPSDTCSVSSTVTASGTDACTSAVVTDTESATCPLVTAPLITVTQNCPGGAVSPGGVVTYTGSVRNAGNITLTNVIVTSTGSGGGINPTNVLEDIIWVNDAVPAGASKFTSGSDTWTWITSNPKPFLGLKAHRSDIEPKTHKHGFQNATDTLHINVGDTLIFYVYLDAAHPTSEIMVEWSDGSFEHRAYWGDNLITFGTDGTDSRRYMGPLPEAGKWVRMEVPASLVGLEGSTLTGMSFDLYNGRAYWDAAGKAFVRAVRPPPGNGTVFTAATLAPGASADFSIDYVVPANNGCSFTSKLTANAANTCTGAQVTDKVTTTCGLATAPAISVTQSCPTTPVLQGGVLTYSGIVHNSGNITLTNVVVMNNRPADNTVIFTVASLAPGASANFTGSYTVPINCCDVWSTVTATGKDTCTEVVVTDTDTATCTVLTTPKIVVTKVCPTTVVPTGGTLQYSGIVSNAGNITLVEVTIVNTQPTAGSPVLGPITLAPGEAVPYDASYVVSPDFCGTDTVTARGLDACTLAPVVNSVTTTCPVITAPHISVTKNCPAGATPRGGVFTFTGSVMNSGNVTLTNVMVVNNYQADCYSRTNGPVIGPITLAPGEVVQFSGSYTAPLSCCEVVDTLTASGQDRCSGGHVTATTTQVCPLLSTPGITVTRVCPTTPVPVGGLFVYTGLVRNTGDVNLTNVTVVSSQPSADTHVLGPIELAPGETKSFSGSYVVTAGSNPTTDTVTAQGFDLCQGRTAKATADCSGPVAQLVINSVSLADGIARITWTTTPGTVYRVQCKASSQETNWITIPGDVTASGATASKDDAVGSIQQRFYRVMVVR